MYSVVIPLHNESGNIKSLVQEIHDTFMTVVKKEYEIVLIDDASTDETIETIEGFRADFPEITLLKHSKQAGQSRALNSGIERARYDVIVTLDGDGQNNPADIPLLLQGYQEQAEKGLVIGHRQNRQDSGGKKTVSRLAFKGRQWVLGDQVPDTGCGLKVFSKTLYQTLPYFNHQHRYFPSLVKRYGAPILSVPISHRPRGSGCSNYGNLDRLLVGLVDIFGVLWLIKRYDSEVKVNVL